MHTLTNFQVRFTLSEAFSSGIFQLSLLLSTSDSKDIGWLADGPEPYTLWAAYANSKLSNLLVTFEMARREELLMEEINKVIESITCFLSDTISPVNSNIILIEHTDKNI